MTTRAGKGLSCEPGRKINSFSVAWVTDRLSAMSCCQDPVDDSANSASFYGSFLAAAWAKANVSSMIDRVCHKLHHCAATVKMHLRATAHSLSESQAGHTQYFLDYLWRQKRSGTLKPLAFVVHQSFDETPLKVALRWGNADIKRPEVGKIFLVGTLGLQSVMRSARFSRFAMSDPKQLQCRFPKNKLLRRD